MYIYHIKEKVMLTSYINKRKLSKKNVIDLFSMHDSIKVTKNQRKKPSVHAIYDYTNVGVVANLLSTSHSTCIKCKQWPLNAFAFIHDTCRPNAKTILQDNEIKMPNFAFTYSIQKALVLPAVRKNMKTSMVCR